MKRSSHTPPGPVYLISLPADEKRRALLAERFPGYSACMIHVPAVDGRQLSAAEYFGLAVEPLSRGRRLMLPTEVGATLSHVRALELFLDSDAPRALILEDDVVGTDASIDAAFSAAARLPERSMLVCGGQDGITSSRRFLMGRPSGVEGVHRVARFSHHYLLRACCYAVTRPAAEHILRCHGDFLRLADAWGDIFNGSSFELYFTNLFAHPVDMADSHLEADRLRLGQKSPYEKKPDVLGVRERLFRTRRRIQALALWMAGYRRLVPRRSPRPARLAETAPSSGEPRQRAE